jgi:hypothetical protein
MEPTVKVRAVRGVVGQGIVAIIGGERLEQPHDKEREEREACSTRAATGTHVSFDEWASECVWVENEEKTRTVLN